jgi:hypothetical protein
MKYGAFYGGGFLLALVLAVLALPAAERTPSDHPCQAYAYYAFFFIPCVALAGSIISEIIYNSPCTFFLKAMKIIPSPRTGSC